MPKKGLAARLEELVQKELRNCKSLKKIFHFSETHPATCEFELHASNRKCAFILHNGLTNRKSHVKAKTLLR
ncbi:MAG: hypothetical protein QW146_03110 [Candidatus Bathyarchaeia archaeon]